MNRILFPHGTRSAAIGTELEKLLPSLVRHRGQSFKYRAEWRLPNNVKVDLIHYNYRHDEAPPPDKVTILYESEWYNGYKSQDRFRRACHFTVADQANRHTSARGIDLDALREKLAEVQHFAEEREKYHEQRRAGKKAGREFAEQQRVGWVKTLPPEALAILPDRDSDKDEVTDYVQKVDHNTGRNPERPVKLILNLPEGDATQVIALLVQLHALHEPDSDAERAH